jgi:hypothetical protein
VLKSDADVALFGHDGRRGGVVLCTQPTPNTFDLLLFTRAIVRVGPRIEPSLRIEPSDVALSQQILGQGVSCEVVAGVFHGTPVAVKRFHARANEVLLPLVEKEVAIFSLLRHPSIVLW